MHFTLKNIRAAKPCNASWRIFARTLGDLKQVDWSAEVSAAEILEICGVTDLEWCFSCVRQEPHQIAQTEWFVRELLLNIAQPRTGFPRWREEIEAILALRADPGNPDLMRKVNKLRAQNDPSAAAIIPSRSHIAMSKRVDYGIYRRFLNTIVWSRRAWLSVCVSCGTRRSTKPRFRFSARFCRTRHQTFRGAMDWGR